MGLCAELLLAAIMLTTGSINTASKKLLYQTEGKNIDGEMEFYEKPWLCTLVMFLGESMCMVAYGFCVLYHRCQKNTQSNAELQSEISDQPAAKEVKIVFLSREEAFSDPTGGLKWKFPLYVSLFASCDLLSTTLTGIGLTYCDASIVQILRGFVIVFTMFSAWIFLKRKPKLHQVIGILFALFGLAMVGTSAVLSNGSTKGSVGDQFLGIGLVLVSQFFSSIQFVLEEKLLKQNSAKVGPIPSMFLVGSEGIAGVILSSCLALPIVNAIPGDDHGSYENFKNSVYMLFHTPLITGLQFLYFISISFFNWSSFLYSKLLSSTSRTLVDACRTILVWLVMVIMYYSTQSRKPKPYGEPLTLWSILEGFGFVGMILGTTTHNDIAGFGTKVTKCCRKEEEAVNPEPLLAPSKDNEEEV